MREELIKLVDKSNQAVNGKLIYVTPEEYVDKILAESIVSTMTIKGVVVGLGAFYANNLEEKKTFLTMICIDPEYEGKGIAKLLMQNWIGYALANNFEKYEVEVGKFNVRTIYLFRNRLGFRQSKENENSYLFESDADSINRDYLGIK